MPLASFSGPGPFPHPYEYEIQHLAYEDWMTSKNTEEAFAGLDSVPFMYVDTAAALDHLIQLLSAEDVREVAIDLEAHSIRSYSGICCLMQVRLACFVPLLWFFLRISPFSLLVSQLSTRRLDAVVDTLALRSEMHKFLDIFTNPAVVKVMTRSFRSMHTHWFATCCFCMQVLHGSKFDVLWLQRDFGLYLVNVFDTGEAARVLKYASFGLAHLLDLFCKVKAQKQFQVGSAPHEQPRYLMCLMIRYNRSLPTGG